MGAWATFIIPLGAKGSTDNVVSILTAHLIRFKVFCFDLALILMFRSVFG